MRGATPCTGAQRRARRGSNVRIPSRVNQWGLKIERFTSLATRTRLGGAGTVSICCSSSWGRWVPVGVLAEFYVVKQAFGHEGCVMAAANLR